MSAPDAVPASHVAAPSATPAAAPISAASRHPHAPATIAEQLAAVPVRNLQVQARDDGAGGGEVEIALVYPPRLRWLAPIFGLRRSRRYRFEPLTWRLYNAIDGRASLRELVVACAGEHRLSFHEARALVGSVLTALSERGLVVLAAPTPPGPPGVPSR
jgi:hypothetical protein